jgi:hypothetical protein
MHDMIDEPREPNVILAPAKLGLERASCLDTFLMREIKRFRIHYCTDTQHLITLISDIGLYSLYVILRCELWVLMTACTA